MSRCVFVETGPFRCAEEATTLVEHRYGKGWYCDAHADWVSVKWTPERTDIPDLVVLTKRSSLVGMSRRPTF